VLLVALQYIVTWSSVRSETIRRLTRSEPRLVVHRGQLLADAMREERLTEEEILSVIRQHGFASVQNVDQVVMETDGTLSVIGRGRE